MFGSKRKRQSRTEEVSPDALESIDRVDLLDVANTPLTAVEAFAAVRPTAERYGDDARMYLVLSADVNPTGLASSWEFHYLFPERHAEGRFIVCTGSTSTTGQAELHSIVMPFPQPGTPEHTMIQSGGYMYTIVEQAWQARLERILGLPTAFHDSTVAVDEMKQAGHPLFSGGALRVKGRTLPSGVAVWEAVTPTEIIHTPFGLPRF